MQEAERAARIDERREEQQAERQPDVGGVDLLGDRALVAAGKLGLDLVVAPRLVTSPLLPSMIGSATSVPLGPAK